MQLKALCAVLQDQILYMTWQPVGIVFNNSQIHDQLALGVQFPLSFQLGNQFGLLFVWRISNHTAEWQKLCEDTKDLCQKVWTRAKILSPNIRYFVATSIFVAIYALFGRLWAKKVFFFYQIQCLLVKKCPFTWFIL